MSLFMYWMLKYHGMHLMELQFSGILDQSKFGYQPECRLEVKAVQTFILYGRILLLCRNCVTTTKITQAWASNLNIFLVLTKMCM